MEKLKPINERAVEDYESVKDRYNEQKKYHTELAEENRHY